MVTPDPPPGIVDRPSTAALAQDHTGERPGWPEQTNLQGYSCMTAWSTKTAGLAAGPGFRVYGTIFLSSDEPV
jgi:hypothetical protein